MRKICSFLSILFLFMCAVFGCNNEEYYFYLTDTNYTIYIEKNMGIDRLSVNTNLPKIDSYQFNFDSNKIKIENNIIYALEEGSVEINLIVSSNNRIYTQTFTLIIEPKIEDEIIASYHIVNVNKLENCIVLIFKKFYEDNEILSLDIFKENGFVSYERVGLIVSIFYYKDTNFEKELNDFI